MKYDVLWTAAAEQTLASLWIDPARRPLINAATDELGALLSTTPIEASESREHGLRIAFVLPFAAMIEIVELEAKVYVWKLWFVERPEE